MIDPFVLLVVVIALAFVFDYINGFHDAANAIATVVSTNVHLFESKGVVKILKGLVLSPIFRFVVGLTVMILLTWIVRRARPARVNSAFRGLQLFSSCGMALSHGSNDAQKVMGVATIAL